MKAKQIDFFTSKSAHGPDRIEYGGVNKKGIDNRKGKRKEMRPFDHRRPVHITMKASKAKGKLSMLSYRNKIVVDGLMSECVAKSHAKLHRYANVGNHVHIFASFPSRKAFQKFMRTFSGRLARLITGARKGKPFGKFWDALAHTIVVIGKKAFIATDRYIIANQFEPFYGYDVREFIRKNLRETWKVDPEDIPEEYRPRQRLSL
jgi:hypothetical protein